LAPTQDDRLAVVSRPLPIVVEGDHGIGTNGGQSELRTGQGIVAHLAIEGVSGAAPPALIA
jgi:hypothetical protein